MKLCSMLFLACVICTIGFGEPSNSSHTKTRATEEESENGLLHYIKVLDYVRVKDLLSGTSSVATKCTDQIRKEYLKLKLFEDELLHVRCQKVTAEVSFVKPAGTFQDLPPFIGGSDEPTSLSVYLTISCEPRPEGQRYRKEMSIICRNLAREIIKGKGNHERHATNPAWQYQELGCSIFSEEALDKIPNTKFTKFNSLECKLKGPEGK